MRLGGVASYFTEVKSRQEIQEAVHWAAAKQLPCIIIGDGSNIIWQDAGYKGLVIANKIMGFEIFKEDEQNLYLTVGAGENWDGVVARAVELGYSGIEQLSLIPGTAGATPVQNVGAYGREIRDALVSVEAYDTQADTFVTIPNSDCEFGYRTSRFKTTDKGRFFISGITLHLTKTNPLPPFYASLQHYLDSHNIQEYTPQTIRQAVIAIRSAKMPDPTTTPNTGSFFANPIINKTQFVQLKADHPGITHWELEDGNIKLSAAWLIEQTGFDKGTYDNATGMAIWKNHSLVLINQSAKTTADVMAFRQKIIEAVAKKFGITLQQEPEII